jgi:hypothetical protein
MARTKNGEFKGKLIICFLYVLYIDRLQYNVGLRPKKGKDEYTDNAVLADQAGEPVEMTRIVARDRRHSF